MTQQSKIILSVQHRFIVSLDQLEERPDVIVIIGHGEAVVSDLISKSSQQADIALNIGGR